MTETVVTIDMGGQTSDISIWQDRKLLWRNSLQFAGRHILTSYLNSNRDLLEQLTGGDSEIRTATEQLNDLSDDIAPYAIEVIINSDAFRRTFASRMNLVEETMPGAGLKMIAEISLSGLVTYIAKILSHLASKEILQHGPGLNIKICLGGRASTLFSALFAEDGALDPVLRLFCAESGGVIGTADVVRSEAPKHEVAYGLLVDPVGANDLEIDAKVKGAITGEPIRVGNETFPANSIVHDLDGSQSWRVDNIPNLEAFCDALDRDVGIRVHLTKKIKNDICGEINRYLANARDELNVVMADDREAAATLKGDSTIVEPPFIVGLRTMVQRLIENPADMAYTE